MIRALLRIALDYAADLAELFAILLFAAAVILVGITLSPEAAPVPHHEAAPRFVAYAWFHHSGSKYE